jgi:AcrR family transcriptional regulator
MQKRKDTLIRQKEIASAARKLIVKYGSENVTVKRMAKEIGVSEGAIYRHFKSKRDIISLLIDDIEKTLVTDIGHNHSKELDSLEVLGKIIAHHISDIEQKKGVSFQVIAEIISLGDKKLNQKIYNVINKYIERVRDILMDGIKAGIIRQDIDTLATARLFYGMTEGIVNIWALSRYSFNLEEEYKSLWNVFLKAISSAK